MFGFGILILVVVVGAALWALAPACVEQRAETLVRRAPEAVFSYFADPEQARRWLPGHIVLRELTPAPIGPGSRYELELRRRWHRIVVRLEIVELDRGRHVLLHEVDRVAGHRVRHEFEATTDGTRIRSWQRTTLRSWAKPLGLLLPRGPLPRLEERLETLRRLAERDAQAPMAAGRPARD